jgi:hypothetical protein
LSSVLSTADSCCVITPSFSDMDPASFAASIITLAGLFNNAVDCFEYVQLGRKFGKRFQTSLLKLDNARLRLSRWGQSVGLVGDLEDARTLERTFLSAEDVNRAEMILGHILDLFVDAKGVSEKFKNRARPGDSTLLVFDTQADLEPVVASLHQKMRNLSIQRQNSTGMTQKVKWALFEEKHFARLIEDITGLVNDLVELFPAARATQRELCEIEVSEMATDENIPILKDVASNQDMDLEEALSKTPQKHTGESYTVTFSGSNNSGIQIGYNVGTFSGLSWGRAS